MVGAVLCILICPISGLAQESSNPQRTAAGNKDAGQITSDAAMLVPTAVEELDDDGLVDLASYANFEVTIWFQRPGAPGEFEFGLRLGYGWNQGNYEVALFGRNITDAEIARGGIDFNNLTGFTNDPRIIGVEFFARF